MAEVKEEMVNNSNIISQESLNNIPDFPEMDLSETIPNYSEFDYAEIELNGTFKSEELDEAYNNLSDSERLALDSNDFDYSRTEAYENGDVKHLFLDDTKTESIRIDATPETATEIREELGITQDDFFNAIALPADKKDKKDKTKEQDKVIDPSLDRKFKIKNNLLGNTVYTALNDDNKVLIKETKNKITTKENHLSITKDLIQIAEDKGWESIKVKGTKEFKKDVWLEAKLRGIEVKGYKPNEQDLRKLSSESEKRGINIIEEDNKDKDPAPALKFENSKITELKEAMASLPKHEAIEKFPELKKVYAVEPSAIAFYKSQKGLPKDQLNEFVEKATDRAITELAQGQEIPDFDAKEIKGSKTKTSTKKEIDFD